MGLMRQYPGCQTFFVRIGHKNFHFVADKKLINEFILKFIKQSNKILH